MSAYKLRGLYRFFHENTFIRGRHLFREGEKPTGVYFLVKGEAKRLKKVV